MTRQQRHIFLAIAQRRQRDVDYVEAVVEILSELAFFDELRKIGVGGGEDAHVDPYRVGGAERRKLFFLDDAEQLDLRFRAERPDLVEENRTAIGNFWK